MKTDQDWAIETAEFRKKVEGKVVNVREANYYDDSDFYATYWDEGKQEFVEYMYHTTRCAGLMGVWAPRNPDAPADLMAKYQDFLGVQAELQRIQSKKFRHGEMLIVARGRKFVGEVMELDKIFRYEIPGTCKFVDYALFTHDYGHKRVNVLHCDLADVQKPKEGE